MGHPSILLLNAIMQVEMTVRLECIFNLLLQATAQCATSLKSSRTCNRCALTHE
jgi:hypothetical protein